MSWIEALKVFNKGKKTWTIPRKGTSEYMMVKHIMEKMKKKGMKGGMDEPAKEKSKAKVASVDKKDLGESAEVAKLLDKETRRKELGKKIMLDSMLLGPKKGKGAMCGGQPPMSYPQRIQAVRTNLQRVRTDLERAIERLKDLQAKIKAAEEQGKKADREGNYALSRAYHAEMLRLEALAPQAIKDVETLTERHKEGVRILRELEHSPPGGAGKMKGSAETATQIRQRIMRKIADIIREQQAKKREFEVLKARFFRLRDMESYNEMAHIGATIAELEDQKVEAQEELKSLVGSGYSKMAKQLMKARSVPHIQRSTEELIGEIDRRIEALKIAVLEDPSLAFDLRSLMRDREEFVEGLKATPKELRKLKREIGAKYYTGYGDKKIEDEESD